MYSKEDIDAIILDGACYTYKSEQHKKCSGKYTEQWLKTMEPETAMYPNFTCSSCTQTIPNSHILRRYSVELHAGGVVSVVQNREILREHKHNDMIDVVLHHTYAPGKTRVYEKARLVVLDMHLSRYITTQIK